MSKNLLFIAFPFPPSRGAGVYRTVATANFMSSRRWDVTVVAPEADYFRRYQGSEDRSLLDWPDPRIEVVRTPVNNWFQEESVPRMTTSSVVFPELTKRARTRWSRFVSPLEGYGFWYRPALKAAMRETRKKDFNAILATGNPFNSFLVAHQVGRRRNIPYVLDYRDGWTFDQFSGDLKPGATDVALSLERRIITRSSAFVSVNQPIVDWLSANHAVPARVQRAVIENGYDVEFLGGGGGGDAQPSRRESLKLVHVGTLVPGKLDWISVLSELIRTVNQLELDVKVHFYGHLGFSDAQSQQLRGMFEGDEVIRHLGPVEKRDVGRVYRDSDGLFLPMYDSPYVTSGKVYEMMASGKPILAWGVETAGALAPLAGYPSMAFANRARPTTWADAVRAVETMATADPDLLTKVSKEHATQYERSNRLRPMANLIESVAI